MSGVERIGSAGQLSPQSRPAAARAPAFRLTPDRETETPGIADSAPADALSVVLALDAEQERGARDRRARRRGQDLLAALAQVQRGLLDGGGAEATVATLRVLLTELPETDDPGLAAAVRAIALRARVELARRETNATGP